MILMKGDISDQLKKAFIKRNEEVRFDGEKKERILSFLLEVILHT